ncbi:YfhD family protein [Anaerobacillus arseniciselenatis]|uniref:YfhD family protein n=1 Tax=Anaerobacillus arseniciselenatis TaxID=85682 RepID=A0A1S2LNA7_9BACI|nr:YfhD family protein [Anaerobacillus arseniciselenatis]
MGKKKKQRNQEVVSDGRDIEFSQELADQDDIEAQERSQAADRRAKKKK